MKYLGQYEISMIFLIVGFFTVGFSISIDDLHILKVLKLKKLTLKYHGKNYKRTFRRFRRFQKAFDNSFMGKKGSVLPMVRVRSDD
jgi:hypothetical protein